MANPITCSSVRGWSSEALAIRASWHNWLNSVNPIIVVSSGFSCGICVQKQSPTKTPWIKQFSDDVFITQWTKLCFSVGESSVTWQTKKSSLLQKSHLFKQQLQTNERRWPLMQCLSHRTTDNPLSLLNNMPQSRTALYDGTQQSSLAKGTTHNKT